MFVWVELYLGNVPDETESDRQGGRLGDHPERQFWLRIIEAGLLAVPGWHFLPDTYVRRWRCANVPCQNLRRPPNRALSHELHAIGREHKLLFFACAILLIEVTRIA